MLPSPTHRRLMRESAWATATAMEAMAAISSEEEAAAAQAMMERFDRAIEMENEMMLRANPRFRRDTTPNALTPTAQAARSERIRRAMEIVDEVTIRAPDNTPRFRRDTTLDVLTPPQMDRIQRAMDLEDEVNIRTPDSISKQGQETVSWAWDIPSRAAQAGQMGRIQRRMDLEDEVNNIRTPNHILTTQRQATVPWEWDIPTPAQKRLLTTTTTTTRQPLPIPPHLTTAYGIPQVLERAIAASTRTFQPDRFPHNRILHTSADPDPILPRGLPLHRPEDALGGRRRPRRPLFEVPPNGPRLNDFQKARYAAKRAEEEDAERRRLLIPPEEDIDPTDDILLWMQPSEPCEGGSCADESQEGEMVIVRWLRNVIRALWWICCFHEQVKAWIGAPVTYLLDSILISVVAHCYFRCVAVVVDVAVYQLVEEQRVWSRC